MRPPVSRLDASLRRNETGALARGAWQLENVEAETRRPVLDGLRDCARAATHTNPQDAQDALAASSSADKTIMETDSWSSRGVCSVAPSRYPGLTKPNSGMPSVACVYV